EDAPVRRKALHDDARVGGDPRRRHARAEDERLVRLALVREEGPDRRDEAGAHPGVRHVADEAGRFGVPPGDLRPRVPARGALIGEEPAEQLERAVALPEADERADVPELVRAVVLPVDDAVAALDELLPVPVVRAG